MSARSRMTMRAAVFRKADGATTPRGTPGAPTFTEQANDVPCRVWSKMREDIVDDGKEAVVEMFRGNFPLDANVLEEDQITVRDRKGTVLFTGLTVDTLRPARGSGSAATHLFAVLRSHV